MWKQNISLNTSEGHHVVYVPVLGEDRFLCVLNTAAVPLMAHCDHPFAKYPKLESEKTQPRHMVEGTVPSVPAVTFFFCLFPHFFFLTPFFTSTSLLFHSYPYP